MLGAGFWPYTYLTLGLVLMGALAVVWYVWLYLPSLRVALAGLVGAVLEVVSENWYFRDYWHPVTLLHYPWSFPEDALYGFAISALAVCAYPFWLRYKYVATPQRMPEWRSWAIVGAALGAFAVMMTVGQQALHINSLQVAMIAFAVIGAVGVVFRPDLLKVGLWAGLIMGLVAFGGYELGLNLINGHAFLAHVELFPAHDWRIPSNTPGDELVWNVARGFCFAVMLPLATGWRLAPRKAR